MNKTNPIRASIINAIQFNSNAVWQFFAVVVFGYAGATYFNLSSRASVDPLTAADLPTLGYVSLAFGIVLLVFLLFSVVVRTFAFKFLNRAVNNKPVKLFVAVAGTAGLLYLVAWNAKYLVANGLVLYTDSPYKFLIILGMAATIVLFAFYVVFVLFLRYRVSDQALQKRAVSELASGALDMEGTIQNADAFNWIRKFNTGSERRLLTIVAGIAPWLLSRPIAFTVFAVNAALFAATAAVMVVFGTADPSGNIVNASANIGSLWVIIGWVLTVCFSYASLEFVSCNWTVARISFTNATDAAYGFLRMVYNRFYVNDDLSVRKKGERAYEVRSLSSSAPLALMRLSGGKAAVSSPHLFTFAENITPYTGLPFEPDAKRPEVGTVAVGNSVYLNLRLFIFASFWATALYEGGARR